MRTLTVLALTALLAALAAGCGADGKKEALAFHNEVVVIQDWLSDQESVFEQAELQLYRMTAGDEIPSEADIAAAFADIEAALAERQGHLGRVSELAEAIPNAEVKEAALRLVSTARADADQSQAIINEAKAFFQGLVDMITQFEAGLLTEDAADQRFFELVEAFEQWATEVERQSQDLVLEWEAATAAWYELVQERYDAVIEHRD